MARQLRVARLPKIQPPILLDVILSPPQCSSVPSLTPLRRLDMILFDAVWTTVFSTAYMLWIIAGAVHILASIASSAIWLLITSILWVRVLCIRAAWYAAGLRLALGCCCRHHAPQPYRRSLCWHPSPLTVRFLFPSSS